MSDHIHTINCCLHLDMATCAVTEVTYLRRSMSTFFRVFPTGYQVWPLEYPYQYTSRVFSTNACISVFAIIVLSERHGDDFIRGTILLESKVHVRYLERAR